MLINTIAVCRVIGLAAIFLLLVAPVNSVAETPRFEGIQLVRYVLETERFIRYRAYAKKIISEELPYDDEYRHPYHPPGPAPVDCARTGRIGVTFLLQRKTKSYRETVTAYFVWTHSSIKTAKVIKKESCRAHFFDGYDGVLVSSGLTLTDEMSVDGTISVQVKVGGRDILKNSFSLRQCPLVANRHQSRTSMRSDCDY